MKRITILLIVISVTYSFGQSGAYCGKDNRLRISEIKKKFPYNKTETIKLVSFKYEYPEMQESDTADVLVPAYEPEMPKNNGAIDFTKMFETKTLTPGDKLIDKIIDVLVNYDNEDRPREVHFCYDPRNGIVFLDKDNNVLGYVEICFECIGYKRVPDTMAVTNFCQEKFDALKDIFKEAGVIYGTVREQR